MSRSRIIIFAVAGFSLLLILVVIAMQIARTQFWRGPDVQFGDQHLKTTVALVELHKVRYGKYPQALSELQFLGDWDPLATKSVSYHANEAGTRYCVEVQRGWIGKPKLEMPADFWHGTGYDPALCR